MHVWFCTTNEVILASLAVCKREVCKEYELAHKNGEIKEWRIIHEFEGENEYEIGIKFINAMDQTHFQFYDFERKEVIE